MTLTVGSLFSGIGGMDLGLERAGMEIRWQVEYAEFPRKVLDKHWPHIPKYGDIKEVDEHALEHVDLICGGFPCQPFSVAGDRKGTSDERWLWPEFYRIARHLQPTWIVIENVPGLLSSGNGSVFGGILHDISEAGYNAQWGTISARDVGAPHKRERLFIIANNSSQRVQRFGSQEVPRFEGFSWCKDVGRLEDLSRRPDIPDALVRGGRNGIPNYVDRIRGIGNAVVPQVAEYIGDLIVNSVGDEYGF